MNHRRLTVVFIHLALASLTLAVFAQVVWFEAVNFDDPEYVFENPSVLNGLTIRGVAWALTAVAASNWHPLTWISLMLDATLYGTNPGGYHATNLLLHVAATLALFAAFRRMTGDLWPSAAVAALFAIHPQHVESVAWIAERKDVLSGFFFALLLLAYQRYARKPSVGGMSLVAALFALGLAAKPMLVTAPFVLLLLDYWPLQRFAQRPAMASAMPDLSSTAWSRPSVLVGEKLPIFALAAACSVWTLVVQRDAGAMTASTSISLSARIANAIIAYAAYLGKTFWPAGLAIHYAHRGDSFSTIAFGASAALLLTISVLAVACARQRPYLLVGWLWYLGMLVPVIGLVQVGVQARADRYTYLPLIGVSCMIAWEARRWMPARVAARRYFHAAIIAVLACMAIVAWKQTGYWRDNLKLYEHALTVEPGNPVVLINLGRAYDQRGRLSQARRCYQLAVQASPDNVRARVNLGITLLQLQDLAGAERQLRRAIELAPEHFQARLTLGAALVEQARFDDAISEYRRLIAEHPRFADAHYNLGIAFLRKGDRAAARRHFESALEIDARHRLAHAELARHFAALAAQAAAAGNQDEAHRWQQQSMDHAAGSF